MCRTLDKLNATTLYEGFPGGSAVKYPSAMQEMGSIPGLGRSPGGGHPFLCPWTFSLFPCVVYLDLNTQYHISKIYLCCCVFNSKDSVASVFLGVLPHFIYSWTIIMNL